MPLDYRPAGFVAEVLIGGPTEFKLPHRPVFGLPRPLVSFCLRRYTPRGHGSRFVLGPFATQTEASEGGRPKNSPNRLAVVLKRRECARNTSKPVNPTTSQGGSAAH